MCRHDTCACTSRIKKTDRERRKKEIINLGQKSKEKHISSNLHCDNMGIKVNKCSHYLSIWAEFAPYIVMVLIVFSFIDNHPNITSVSYVDSDCESDAFAKICKNK